ncbi:winged helix DNA-binding domain-containing protein [Mycetocola sp. 2940]|uniref:winged helix DNA-binding domain-containing protein n=1 Tax=Mycetocola sp. 2940 TaxID=3156452 RepID=UPI003393D761
MDPLDIVRRRLVSQRLAGEPFDTVADAVGWLGAVQAQEFAEAKWSLAERVRDCTDADVEEAFSRGDIVRTHVLRPTWHFLTREDARWILRLTRPRVHALNAYWYRRAELDDGVFARADGVFAGALAGGATRTRAELAARLSEAGIEAAGPRLAYLLMHAELNELICNGPRRGRQHTYALFDDRVPVSAGDERPYESALDEFVFRYVRSHGPATVRDFTTWSSLPVRDSRAALARLEDKIESVVDENGIAWFSARDAASIPLRPDRLTGAFLLPMYDETIVAYQDLRVVLAHAASRADLIERAIVIDARTVGSWKRTLTKDGPAVAVTLFGELTEIQMSLLQDAVARFGRFLGIPATLEIRALS